MARPEPAEVQRVAIVGTGVIGAGWAANFLARGLDVTASDPGPEAEPRLRQAVENAWPALQRAGLAPGADPGRLSFTADLDAALADAQFVQESAPEREDLKTELLARIDKAAPPGVVIASSSSGLLPSRIQSAAAEPGRILIGHPFNPVYLLPLVEVVAGEATEPAAVDWAIAFYRWLGKEPLHVRREVPGYISDRLQEALWREALHMVAEGVATTDEIDAAITGGPGPRWAFMGPCLTFHLAGGDAGMAHMLEQFGPALKLPWTKLEAPELTDELSRRMIEGTAAQAHGKSVKTLEVARDAALMRVLAAQAAFFEQTDSERVTTPYEGRGFPRLEPGQAIPAPLALHRTPVLPAWVDYNGHMSESCYLLVFGDASDALFRYVGIDEAYRAAGGSFYTVESHLNNYRDVAEGEPLEVTTQLLDLDAKRLHLFHAMHHGDSGELMATAEQMLLHVDMTGPKAAPIRGDVHERLQLIVEAHSALPPPEQVGHAIGIPRPVGAEA